MKSQALKYFLVGIKGTGMSHLACLLKATGKQVSGCDQEQIFPTDLILKQSNIKVFKGFSKDLFDATIQVVIYSTAYEKQECEIIDKYKQDENILCYSYPEFVASLTKERKTYAVAGTHGKTTVSGLVTFLLATVTKGDFSFFSLFGSSLIDFEPVIFQGDENMVLEACEYQDHFLKYEFDGLIVTNIELDHVDYFKDISEVNNSFKKVIFKIRKGGFLICNGDDRYSYELALFAKKNCKDIVIVTYGFKHHNTFQISKMPFSEETYHFSLRPEIEFSFPFFNKNLIGDCLAASIFSSFILLDRKNPRLYLNKDSIICDEILTTLILSMAKNTILYKGVKGRKEITGIQDKIIYLEDYAHHPTEIEVFLDNIKKEYPGKKLFVIFFPHTYSRTKGLYSDFLKAFNDADYLFIYKTFSSARNDCQEDGNQDLAKTMADQINRNILKNPLSHLKLCWYTNNEETLVSWLVQALQEDSLCISMGAGNYHKINEIIIKERRKLL